jgi:hypothetical protein
MTRNVYPDGPLVIPAHPSYGRLTRSWQRSAPAIGPLPGGFRRLHPAVDEIREEHLRVRSQVKRDIAALAALLVKHQAEDLAHATALRDAHLVGGEQAKDRRTPRIAGRCGENLCAGPDRLLDAILKATSPRSGPVPCKMLSPFVARRLLPNPAGEAERPVCGPPLSIGETGSETCYRPAPRRPEAVISAGIWLCSAN